MDSKNTASLRDNLVSRKSAYPKKVKSITAAFGFLIIPLIFFTVFVIAPVFQAGYFSVFKWNGLGPLTDLIGMKNFSDILADPIFYRALTNNLLIIFFSIVIELPIALALSLAIGRKFKGSVIFRPIFFLPYILSEVIAGVVWSFIMNPQFGLQNTWLVKAFPSLASIEFLGDPNLVFFSIMFVIVWKYFGLHMVIYIAGLQNISDEIEEAAYIDGVNSWELIWHIILPLLRPTILLSVFFSVIGSLQTFDIIWAMGKGDPVHAAETMVTYLYKFGYQRFSLGYGSAIAIIIFVICVTFNIFYQKMLTRQEQM
jgi:raffinose/stachyose/melibiose transport system permease protein